MSIDRILGWFPNTWRARYDAEVRDLLESRPFGWRERRDLLRCCADALIRAGKCRAMVLARRTLSLGVRIGLVVGVGWLGAKGVTWAEPLIGASAWSEKWSGSFAALSEIVPWFKIAAFIVLAKYAIMPFATSGREVDRPGWWQVVAGVWFLLLLQLLDPRPPHSGDIIFFGMVATMRYASWLGFFAEPRRHEHGSILMLRQLNGGPGSRSRSFSATPIPGASVTRTRYSR